MLCGECGGCPAYLDGFCSGCPGCGRLLLKCTPGRQCGACGYICPDRPGVWDAVYGKYKGLALPAGEVASPDLPPYVPVVTAPLHERAGPDELLYAAIHGGKFRAGAWERGIRGAAGLPGEAGVILDLYVPDEAVRSFLRNRGRWLGALRANRAASFAPNISVYEDSPRLEHLLAMKASALFALELSAAGVPVVLDVSWYEKADLDRWAAFIRESGAGCAAFSFQTVGKRHKGSSAWKGYLAGFRYFCSLLPPGVRVAVVGAASRERLRAIAAAAGGRPLTLVDTESFVSARRGKLLYAPRRKGAPRPGSEFTRDGLFRENARRVREFWSGLTGRP